MAIVATARFEGAGLPLETFPYQEIHLSVLDDKDLSALAAAHLGEPAGTDLLGLLAERSEGNPFSARLMLRYFQEAGWLVRRDGTWRVSLEKRREAPLPFRHALERDADYQTQVRARQQALHALALESLERLYLYESVSSGDPVAADHLSPRYDELA